MDTSPGGFQSYLLQRLISQVHILKVGVPDRDSNALLLKEKLRVVSSLLVVGMALGLGWMASVSASPSYFSVGFLLVCVICRSHSTIFWISFRAKCSLGGWLYIWCVHGSRGVQDLLKTPS